MASKWSSTARIVSGLYKPSDLFCDIFVYYISCAINFGDLKGFLEVFGLEKGYDFWRFKGGERKFFNALVAQLVAHQTSNLRVVGSIPI